MQILIDIKIIDNNIAKFIEHLWSTSTKLILKFLFFIIKIYTNITQKHVETLINKKNKNINIDFKQQIATNLLFFFDEQVNYYSFKFRKDFVIYNWFITVNVSKKTTNLYLKNKNINNKLNLLLYKNTKK